MALAALRRRCEESCMLACHEDDAVSIADGREVLSTLQDAVDAIASVLPLVFVVYAHHDGLLRARGEDAAFGLLAQHALEGLVICAVERLHLDHLVTLAADPEPSGRLRALRDSVVKSGRLVDRHLLR